MHCSKSQNRIMLIPLWCVCIWNLIYALWNVCGQSIPARAMTVLLLTLGLSTGGVYAWKMQLRPADMGLSLTGGRYLLADAGIAAAGVAVLALFKMMLCALSPELFAHQPFWDWSRADLSYWLYPLTVASQQLLSQGLLHESLRQSVSEPKGEDIAMCATAAVFSTLHIHLGIVYMLGAMVMIILLGILYRHQRSIWGLCIIHYALGMAGGYLGFL